MGGKNNSRNKEPVIPKCKCGHNYNMKDQTTREISCLHDDCICVSCHTWKFDKLTKEEQNWLLEHQAMIEMAKVHGKKELLKDIKSHGSWIHIEGLFKEYGI